MYGLETAAIRKKEESELEVAEMKMQRFEFGLTRMDMIRSSLIRDSLHVVPIRNKVREARLRWYGYVNFIPFSNNSLQTSYILLIFSRVHLGQVYSVSKFRWHRPTSYCFIQFNVLKKDDYEF